ncbi:hypothetical protein RFH51_12560, partial [Acinetobacter gerneri]|nr:hypothetical protein [Acinetobacter gerneri]MDQ9072290.1 hypothetical protein [Acinetobacter gerneri]
ILMFITSFEEQNITYRSCSNLRIHLYIWAYVLTCFVLIALWFSFPRMELKKIMQERKARGEF